MKKKKFSKKLQLKKMSVANLNKVDGGARNITIMSIVTITDPTAQTNCYICYETINGCESAKGSLYVCCA